MWDVTVTRMTANEYFAVSVVGDRMQLVEGELVLNQPGVPHGLAQGRLLTALTNWVNGEPSRGLALPPVDVVVDDYNVFGPDLVWLSEARVPDPLDQRLKGLPDLAAEVRSAGTWRYDVGKKKAAYERAGLPELWLVDTDARAVLVFRRSAPGAPSFDVELELSGQEELASPLLPGFALPVERLFSR